MTATAIMMACDTEIAGCQDELACNYNPDATDAAACEYAADGFDCDGNPISCPEDINGNGTVEVSDVPAPLRPPPRTPGRHWRRRRALPMYCSCSPRLGKSADVCGLRLSFEALTKLGQKKARQGPFYERLQSCRYLVSSFNV